MSTTTVSESTAQTMVMPSSVPVAPGSGGYAYGFSNSGAALTSTTTFSESMTQTMVMPSSVPVAPGSGGYAYGSSNSSSTSSPVVPFTGGADSVTSMRQVGFAVGVAGVLAVLGCL